MFKHKSYLAYPLNIKHKDLNMAKLINTQFGGASGELGAALRYLSQSYTMPTKEGKELLQTIAAEEFSHIEMVNEMVHMLTKDATIEEMKMSGFESNYTEHGLGIYPSDSASNPFTAAYIASTGDILADLSEDMAAEEKARATYEHLIDLATDPEVINPLLFLRQREIVHFRRFKELYNKYKKEIK